MWGGSSYYNKVTTFRKKTEDDKNTMYNGYPHNMDNI